MSRQKRSELEELRCENKELKSLVKSLQRQLKKQRKEHKEEFNQDDLIREDLEDRKERCPQCQKGEIKTTSIGIRKIVACINGCGYRKVEKT